MRSHARFSLFITLAFTLLLGATPAGALGPITESQSRFSFAETVTRLQAELKRKGWKVVKVHDLQASMKKHGHAVLPVKVMAACHPQFALKVLQNDDARLAAAMMPCRIAVYDKKDGKTYVSRPDLTRMALKGSPMAKPMATAAGDIEKILGAVIKKR